jgi:2-hydroxychromene-2-carboxylate isomerase
MNLKTRLRSTAMRYFSSESYQLRQQTRGRRQREKRKEMPVVHYFHQVDDPYSHLAVQKLDALRAHYDLDFQPHLVSMPDAAHQGSAEHFMHWARVDAESIADAYGTTFAPTIEAPGADAVAYANQALAAHLDQDDFAQAAIELGEALWSNQPLETTHANQNAMRAVDEGDALRDALGHYQGAMFYFDGEWFWGLDRLRLLEERLIAEGFGKGSSALCVPEPTANDTTGMNASDVLLEYFPSLRSPYTAVGHQRVEDLIARSGVSVQVRPVMPMLMRGIPAPRNKQRYIITDAGREARAHSVPFGRIVDPFGEPVRRAFALFPGAAALGHDMSYVRAYLTAAWIEGVDITNERGLRRVAKMAGINWDELQQATQDTDWETVLDDNLTTMLQANLWGVPSFRVSGGNSDHAYACWGQDRIWRVENEIARRV